MEKRYYAKVGEYNDKTIVIAKERLQIVLDYFEKRKLKKIIYTNLSGYASVFAFSEDELDACLDILLKEGIIYEPTKGVYQYMQQ